MSTAFSRVLSLRDRKRNTSKTRLDVNNLFTFEEKTKKIKDEEKKIQDLSHRLALLGIPDVPQERIEYALRSRSSQGDIQEALKLLLLYEDSVAGVLKPFDPTVRMLGAENREKTTCFLDSLLFAMFATPGVFEAILFNNFDDEHRRKLVIILRLWVNLLRSGRLVTTDIIAKLQESLAECGWADAAKIRQQDASEAFAFITDKLQMPLLTLKTDIYHSGKEDDKDDHKFITERMLDVAIPENVPQGEIVTLEMCLEDYFNNRVEVKRHLQRQSTLASNAAERSSRHSSIDKGGALYVETTEVDDRDSSTPLVSSQAPPAATTQRPLHMRQRATSIFSERKVTHEVDEPKEDGETNPAARQRAASVKKEVLMPAWQFLNLIPWYADNAAPDNDAQVKQHFTSRRPMLGICLKRYNVDNRGYSYRLGTHVDIPLEMATPHFADEDQSENGQTSNVVANVKLSLQSVVCHRGHSVEAGHYISFTRASNVGPAYGLRPNPHIDGDEDVWLRFDDLAADRVVPVDIKSALSEESPYLLFYKVQPLEDEVEQDSPPAYAQNLDSLELVDQKLAGLHLDTGATKSFDIAGWSRRGSTDGTIPEEPSGRTSLGDGRRLSLAPTSAGSVIGSVTESVRTLDQIATEPPTPLEKGNSDPASTMNSNLVRPSSGDSGSAPAEKRFSMSMSRIVSRFGREQKSSPDIIISEVRDDELAQPLPPPVANIAPIHSVESMATPETGHVSIKQDGLSSEPIQMQAKATTKEKKRKGFMSRSRRGSGQKEHAPDRECIVM